jgi:hypothetical protein
VKEPQILTGEPTTPQARLPGGDVYRLWPLFFVAGAVFTLTGWAEVLLIWYPIHFGHPDWEFDTIARTFDLLPLGTVGLTLVSAAIIARGGKPWPIRILAVVFMVLMVVAFLCAADYLYRLPEQWQRLSQPGRPEGAKRAIAKTIVFMVGFTSAYAAAGQVLWRTARESDPLR